MNTTKHQIRVDGQLVNAFYATKETALQRVEIARKAGHDAEYAGTVQVDPLSRCGLCGLK